MANATIILRRYLTNYLGFFILCCLLVLQPFHFIITDIFPYYRESFAIIFTSLSCSYIYKYAIRSQRDVMVRKEQLILFVFSILIIFFALVDPGINLYDFDPILATKHLCEVSPTVYVLRNVWLYIPMVFYLAFRGLSIKEIKLIAAIIALTAPISVLAFVYYFDITDLYNMKTILELGGNGLAYNSYVPYLTFPTISALYLSVDLNKRYSFLFVGISVALIIYLLASTSRQSVLFIILVLLLYVLYFGFKYHFKWLVSFLFIILFIGYFILPIYATNLFISDRLIERYSSVEGFTETNRLEIALVGLKRLDPFEIITGAGLTSVIVSGPHNDYIRWTQRIGFPFMLIGFLPFFLSFWGCHKRLKLNKKKVYFFVLAGLFFTIFHSFFGHPREDAFQALYVFLGLVLWLALIRNESNCLIAQPCTRLGKHNF